MSIMKIDTKKLLLGALSVKKMHVEGCLSHRPGKECLDMTLNVNPLKERQMRCTWPLEKTPLKRSKDEPQIGKKYLQPTLHAEECVVQKM